MSFLFLKIERLSKFYKKQRIQCKIFGLADLFS